MDEQNKTLPHFVWTTIIDDVMTRAAHNKLFVKSDSFIRDLAAQNVQQRNIKVNYIALPHRMARFSIEEHNEHW